jgi:putative membrane protein
MRHTLFALLGISIGLATPAWAADSDAEFVEKAALGGMTEVELGRYASQHAASARVKEFGQHMVSDHGKANAELSSIAKRLGLAVPTALDAEHREEVAELTAKTGTDFDEAYMKKMVEAHGETASAFRDQAKESKTEIDRFAARTLPTVEKHLSMARSIESTLHASR